MNGQGAISNTYHLLDATNAPMDCQGIISCLWEPAFESDAGDWPVVVHSLKEKRYPNTLFSHINLALS